MYERGILATHFYFDEHWADGVGEEWLTLFDRAAGARLALTQQS